MIIIHSHPEIVIKLHVTNVEDYFVIYEQMKMNNINSIHAKRNECLLDRIITVIYHQMIQQIPLRNYKSKYIVLDSRYIRTSIVVILDNKIVKFAYSFSVVNFIENNLLIQ